MGSREDLQYLLAEILGNDHVYYQPPATLKIMYPAIIYSKDIIDVKHADNKSYLQKPRYKITVIDRRPDNEAINKLLELEYCSYDRHYVYDNLNHDVLTLYY